MNRQSATNSADQTEANDAFTHHVMRRIAPEILDSFSPQQRQAIHQALSEQSGRRHTIDVRISIPLFFARYYFVVLLGRDRRKAIRSREQDRRDHTNSVASLLFLLFLLLPLGLMLFMALYWTKVEMGIDIFPGLHLRDIIRPLFLD